ncbi:branched-chain amino acid ABC transporter permease [Haloarcula sp. KBTZ06]|uniref:Branched-chain amino acid ABC transporter permease n=1 Tax=Haloarcula hispanica TaxID=51589 RepID=A0A482TCI8_HALHI|nr:MULTISPECIES: branched-chain amino acid ABC transporter permease [Haloarcula]AJF25129.1 branched-chain amino acid ABC transporter permease [Haloarcula sp. CBA1115]MCJ0619803.1 branched-chain amino acid ABC transporter permease [Haloarcula hispanica]MUV48997.1 branched-chain amino acid ABC transporter permease [Haloarcula sp. CBA1122]RYJ10255.1 branched-chain amino acid ABC transporter permease [Haloarcula hispanica]
MSDREQTGRGIGRLVGRAESVLRDSVLPQGAGVIGAVGQPAERLLWPVAERYNRTLGKRFGEITGLQLLLLLVAFGGLVTAPLWGQDYLRPLTLGAVWAVFAMGWDIQSGYTGYISFGHSALSGAAGYTTGLLVLHLNPELSLFVTVPLSILATTVLGLAIAVPSLRLRGPYFSLVTFVTVLLFYRLTKALSHWTNGLRGIRVDVFTYDLTLQYYMVVVPMLAVAATLTYVGRSDVGTVLVAIRENEDAVSAAGLDPTKFKLWSFVLSAVPMGIGGVLLAHVNAGVDPQTFVIVDNSIQMIAMAVIGGMSSILGPLGGAFLFVGLRDVFLVGLGEELRWLALWLLVLLVLVFARDGLFRLLWRALGALGGDRR